MGIMENWKSPEHSFFYDSNIESRLKPKPKVRNVRNVRNVYPGL